ncbi:MAG: TVP38/TMEM64 family protein [Actinobacteria bacterium]|nr:TVP38/TMEM64 family protein [Actinomycetota bacterium]
MKRILKGYIGKLLVLLAVVLLYGFVPAIKVNVNQAFFILSNLDVELVKGYILGFGIWAPIASFILMVFQSIVAPLPAFLITFANAALFGWIKGAILSWSSSMVGALVCFYIARYFGRAAVERLTSRIALEGIDDFFKNYGKYAILIARLLPFVSFDVVSYAAGLTSMSFWSFFVATGIGQLPATIVYSYVGSMLTGSTKTMVTGLLILFALSISIMMFKKVWTDRKKGEVECIEEGT